MSLNERSRKRKRWFAALSLFLVAGAGGTCWWWSAGGPDLGRGTARGSSSSHATASAEPSGEREQGLAGLPSDARAAADMFCGPRSVQFVLRHFGQQEDLYDLIQEVQERDWRRGASLASIDRALCRRGVHTAAIRVDNSTILRWPEPMIVHLRSARQGDLGHFVVQLPATNDGEARFWCGLAGEQTTSIAEASALRTGAVLLTSANEINSPFSAVVTKRRGSTAFFVAASALAAGLGLCLSIVRLHSSKKRLKAMTKKQLCGGAALLLLGTAFALLKEQAPVNSFLSADEALSIFGGQAGSCYQNAPETCPSSTTPASCNTYPCATNYNITCNENGNMVTYTSCYCATSDYLFGQVNNPNYQSAVDMGQNAKNGNTGETQQPGKFCGSAQLCQQYSTCDNLCSACFIGASGTLVCNIQYSFNSVYPVYAPDPNTPACPQQIGLLRDPIPRSSFAVAWHNGAFLQLAN